jgi:hypothetical protein
MGESSCLVWSDAIDRNGQANRDQVQDNKQLYRKV